MGRPKGSGVGLPARQVFPLWERKASFIKRLKANPITGCIEWTGVVNNKGYGFYCFNAKIILAHRFAWLSKHGDISSGSCVLHRCDNRLCCNVDHLFLGTVGDNNRDMWAKGRNNPAPRWRRKLTSEQVVAIRKMWVPHKMSMRKIAQVMNITPWCVASAIYKWKGLPDAP